MEKTSPCVPPLASFPIFNVIKKGGKKHQPSSGVSMATDPESVQCFETSFAAPPPLSALFISLCQLLWMDVELRPLTSLPRDQTHNKDHVQSLPLTSWPTLVQERDPEDTVANSAPHSLPSTNPPSPLHFPFALQLFSVEHPQSRIWLCVSGHILLIYEMPTPPRAFI